MVPPLHWRLWGLHLVPVDQSCQLAGPQASQHAHRRADDAPSPPPLLETVAEVSSTLQLASMAFMPALSRTRQRLLAFNLQQR